jgi:hypothetical protein
LDADTSIKALQRALGQRGHDVTRTPNPWMPLDASDETQLLAATLHGRIIFTFNIRDFVALAKTFPQHAGILLAAQTSWTLSSLIRAVDHLLSTTQTEIWLGRVAWLNEWRQT